MSNLYLRKAALAGFAALLGTTAYEATKEACLGSITRWQSHFITILFCAAVVFILSAVFLRREQVVSVERLHESVVFSDSLMESLPGVICLFDPASTVRRWNTNFLGYPPADNLAGWNHEDYGSGKPRYRAAGDEECLWPWQGRGRSMAGREKIDKSSEEERSRATASFFLRATEPKPALRTPSTLLTAWSPPFVVHHEVQKETLKGSPSCDSEAFVVDESRTRNSSF